jgi:hypothetical protein
MAANQPTLIPEAWASQGSRTTIPDTTSETGRASWALGFPPETALPLGAGGVPPHWLDFQGVLYALSSHAIFQQQGGRYGWEATLDYPAGACVLGSNGQVYQASQASGPGTAAGAKDPTSAANSAYWGAAATPDGSTIKVINGKLTVDNASVAPLLADNVTTVNNAGKIAVDLSNATAAALKKISQYVAKSDGGLRMDSSTGKLIVDFNLMPTDEFESIVQGMVQTGGGLAVDSNGQIYVDFDSMPTSKFEDLLKSLKMQIPLSYALHLHVDTNSAAASDVIEDGRGTAAKPFKTINACVSWAASNYALGQNNIDIAVHPGTYSEDITLPVFNATTGRFYIRASDNNNPPVIQNTNNGETFRCTGGTWALVNLKITNTPDGGSGSFPAYPRCLSVTSGGDVYIYGVDFELSYGGAAADIRSAVIEIDNATVHLMPTQKKTKLTFHKGNASFLHVLAVYRRGQILWHGTNSQDNSVDVECTGEATTFGYFSNSANMGQSGAGTSFINFVVPSGQTVTGKQYAVEMGSGVYAPENGLPGDTAGTVDSSTYCWYKERNS